MTEENKDLILLGIKYESAKIAGVSETALEDIAAQLREEAGESWETDPMILQGRDAVRREYGLDLGTPVQDAEEKPSSLRSRWRLFRRRP